MIRQSVDLALGVLAVNHRDQVIADEMTADMQMRQRSRQKLDVRIGAAAEVTAVMVGRVRVYRVLQQLDVLAIDAA